MFPPLRMNSLFPIKQRPDDDSVESLFSRYSNLLPQNTIHHDIADRIINRYAPPNTTNTNISYGLTPANTQINTKTSNEINPLDLAKLNLKKDELASKNENNKNTLDFKTGKQDQDNAIRQTRADVYKFKAEHPGMKFDFSGPTIKVADPITGEVHDTGRPSGHLSDEDKINLGSKDRINEIGARATETRKTNETNSLNTHLNRLGEIEATGNQNRKTNAEKPSNNSSTQQRVGYANKARELANSNPAFAKWIKMNGNEFSITPPSSGGMFGSNGPDADTYHKINEAIYGQSNDQNKSDTTKNTNTNEKDNKSNSFSSSTTKLYTDKAGNKYNIPMDKITEFLRDNPDAIEVK